MKIKITLIFLLTFMIVSSAVISLHAQVPWTEYGSNPIFGQGTSPAGPKAYYCKVVYDASSFSGHGGAYLYKMWYGTSGGQTGLAYSNDGIVWTDQGAVMTNGYHAQVIYDASGFGGGSVYYKMWYWGGLSYNASDIRYTESSDGVDWTNDQPLQNGTVVPYISGPMAWNRGSYGPSTVFYNPSATNTGTDLFNYTYTMYYDGTAGGTESTGLAYSTDGIIWNGYDADADGDADPVLQGTASAWDHNYAVGWTIVKNASNDFEMWYSGGNGAMNHGIGYAISSDGINWTKDASNPIFYKYDGITWRDNRTYTPSVIKNGSTYKMWFTGKSTTGSKYSIGYATGAPPAPTEKWVAQTGGSDANDGNTESTAYATLQHAIDNSNPGNATTQSIINVKDGTYGIIGQTNQDGYSTAILIKDKDYLTIQAVPGHEPIVKPLVTGNIVSISVENSDHLIVDNIDSYQTISQFDNWHVFYSDDLTLRNSTFEGGEDGIDFNTSMTTALIENNVFKNITTGNGDEVLDFTDGSYSDVTIQDNTFKNNYRQVTLKELSGKTITDFTIRRNIMDGTNSEEAIRLIRASNILIENNVIMNNLQQGIYIDNGCSDITINHNSFFNNNLGELGTTYGEIRIKPDPTTNNIIVKNNIIYGNGSNPAFESVTGWTGEDYNLVYNTTDIGSFTFGSNTITGQDPLFVSTTAGSEDLHLLDGSLAIAAGTDLGVTDDVENSNRPQPVSSNPDMGAYESAQPLFPMALIQGVRDDLADLLPTGDKKTDKRIEKALKHIDKSLKSELWENPSQLTKKGKKVFDEDKKAVKELTKIVKDKKNDLLKTEAQEAIDKLVAADQALAQTAIDDAVTAGGKTKEIDKAQKEMVKASDEISKGKFDKAIEHYKKAWKHAQKAIKKMAVASVTGNNEIISLDNSTNIPVNFSLNQNYPNPFNPTTVIKYALPEASFVTLKIYNMLGQEIKTLVSGNKSAGVYNVQWNGEDNYGNPVATGTYIYRVIAGSNVVSKKMILLK